MKKLVRLVIISLGLLVMALNSGTLRAQTVEDGSAEHPFLIENKQELMDFRNCVNLTNSAGFYFDGHTYRATNPGGDSVLNIPRGGSERYFKLTTDIVLNEGNVSGCDGVAQPGWTQWTPIGSSSQNFLGYFDGDYHVVQGLYINSTASYSALFGVLGAGAEVKNLGVVNAYVNANRYTAAFVALNTGAHIHHCFVDATVYGQDSWTALLVAANQENGLIDSCYATGTISSPSYFVAGICGYNYVYSTIKNCYSTCVIDKAASNAGSIEGYNEGDIVNCFFDKQMCDRNSTFSTGMLTSVMLDNEWSDLGPAFVTSNTGYYPRLSGFSGSVVTLSVTPILLGANSTSDYNTIDKLKDDFELGGRNDNVTWTISNERYVDLDAANYKVYPHKQGFFILTASLDGFYHTVSLRSFLAPMIGTEHNPYTIDNYDDLIKFRDCINSGLNFTWQHYNVKALADTTWFRQTTDIVIPDGVTWSTCIGNSNNTPFQGIYDGGGHEIVNLTLKSNTRELGFFKWLNGDVCNLGFRDVSLINVKRSCGSLCAYFSKGKIQNCYVTGNNSTINGTSEEILGALVGSIKVLATDSVCIDHCYNRVPLTGTTDLGGIVGTIDNASRGTVIFSNCYNYGDIVSKTKVGGGGWGVAGILGRKNSNAPAPSFIHCVNYGNILAHCEFVGGICGLSYNASFTDCHNYGDITVDFTGRNSGYIRVGGIEGYQYYAPETYCSNAGNITLIVPDGQTGSSAVGVGTGNDSKYCFNTGKIISKNVQYSYGVRSASGYNAGEVVSLSGHTVYGSQGNYTFNVASVQSEEVNGTLYPTSGSYTYYDSQMCPVNPSSSNAKRTEDILGDGLKGKLGEDEAWVFTEGMYPRLRGIENLPHAIAAAMPVHLNSAEDANAVKSNFTLSGCDSSVNWQVFSGNFVDRIESNCANNQVNAILASVIDEQPVELGAALRDTVYKRVTLYPYIPVPADTLTIDNLDELTALRNGVNSGKAFYYKHALVPRYAAQTNFKLTTDIDMAEVPNWGSIGCDTSSFRGRFFGENHRISHYYSDTLSTTGLFGLAKNATIRDLTLSDLDVSYSGNEASYLAGICAISNNDSIFNCHTFGHIHVNTTYNQKLYVGAVSAYNYGKFSVVNNCTNHCDMQIQLPSSFTSGVYVAGIMGWDVTAATKFRYCYNYGNLEVDGSGTGRMAGIVVQGGTCYYCANYGNLTNSLNIAGINDYGSTEYCFNAGNLTSRTGSIKGVCAGVANYSYNVGEINILEGNSASTVYGVTSNRGTYCYNAGTIRAGKNGTVAGIAGQYAQYCFNAAVIRGEGQLSAIARLNNSYATPSFYDKQLCVAGAIAGADIAGKGEGKSTTAMLGDGLRGKLGNDNIWVFTEGMYPRLAGMDTGLAAVCSAMPILLQNEETAANVVSNFEMHGCDSLQWTNVNGTAINLDNAHCQAEVAGLGYVKMGVGSNDKVWKTVYLSVGITEENPFVIKNLTELKHFRDGINSEEPFYYRLSDSTYAATYPSGQESDYIQIIDHGQGYFFKIINDIDMDSEADWIPIGDYTTNPQFTFRGSLDGDGHCLSNLHIGAGSYRGLFGYLQAANIKSLEIRNASLVGSGDTVGILAAYVLSSDIRQCRTVHSIMEGNSRYTGGLCGFVNMSDIKNCFCDSLTINTTGPAVAGLFGLLRQSTVDSCYNINGNLTFGESFGAGICAINAGSTVQNCYNKNTIITFTKGINVGGICGLQNTNCHSGYTDGGKVQWDPASTNGILLNCYNEGGLITGKNSVGGVCGKQYLGTSSIKQCYNLTDINGVDYVGGIVGNSLECNVGYSFNKGNITATNSNAGGIAGSYYGGGNGGIMTNCYNNGSVQANSYAGGIAGSITNSTDVKACFNTGEVKALLRAGGMTGGISAVRTQFTACYNTGKIVGEKYVGGIFGLKDYQSTSYFKECYNIGEVSGYNFVGSLFGSVDERLLESNYYDLQLLPNGGVNMEDISNKAQGLLTNEMTGNGLAEIFTDTNWVFGEGMYPRLKPYQNTPAALVAAQPLNLPSSPDTVKIYNLPSDYDFTANGCDQNVVWSAFNSKITVSDCNMHTGNMGFVYLSAAQNDTVYKRVKASIMISEDNPLLITSLEQLKNFRDCINRDSVFYYDPVNYVYYKVDNSGDGSYVEVPVGGDGFFFKLTNDINLTVESSDWIPIGNYAANTKFIFRGSFNGDNHQIIGLTNNKNQNYKGLFGYNKGTVKNLGMVGTTMSNGGAYVGSIVGVNEGMIRDCYAVDGKISGNQYAGGVCGTNNGGSISTCYNRNEVVASSNYAGGISGSHENGSELKYCYNVGRVKASSSNSYAGGIAGAASGSMKACFNFGLVEGAQCVGGIAGTSNNGITYCYSAAEVKSSKTAYVGAVVGYASSADAYPYNCYYDNQMCSVEGGVGQASMARDADGRAEGRTTAQMLGLNIQTLLGADNFEYDINGILYPQIKSFAGTDASVAATTPVYLHLGENVSEVVTPFTVETANDVVWGKSGYGRALNVDNATGKVRLLICGEDVLKVSKDDDYKTVTMNVLRMENTSTTDTTCGEPYLWTANHKIYTVSGDYPEVFSVGIGCDSIITLHITIPQPLSLTLQTSDETCFEYNDGTASATVTGGFGQYNYQWLNSANEEVGTGASISNLAPGSYTCVVTDAIHPDCQTSKSFVINAPGNLFETELLAASSNCFNSADGTIELSLKGGYGTYLVSWTGPQLGNVTVAENDYTIANLADGVYTVEVFDAQATECPHKTIPNIEIKENDTAYVVTSYGLNKMYDGDTVKAMTYTLQIGDAEAVEIVSGTDYELANHDVLHVELASPTCVDAGIYPNTILSCEIKRNDEDVTCLYNIVKNSKSVVINQRELTLTSATEAKVFDATELSNSTVTVTGDGFIGEEGFEFCRATGSILHVGTEQNPIEYVFKDNTKALNYKIAEILGTLTITSVNEITVVIGSEEYMYNGDSHSNNADGYQLYIGTEVTYEEGTVFSADLSAISRTDVGVDSIATVAVHAMEKGVDYAADFTWVIVKGTLKVKPREVILISETDSKTYDGTALERPSVLVGGQGFVPGEVSDVYAVGSITTVGSIENDILLDTTPTYKRNNYEISYDKGTLSIEQRPVTFVGESKTISYDGSLHTLTEISPVGLLQNHTFEGLTYAATGKTPGDYDGEFDGVLKIKESDQDVTGNYLPSMEPGLLKINPAAAALVIVSDTASKVYDATPLTQRHYMVTYGNVTITAENGTDTLFILPTSDSLKITPTGSVVNAGTGLNTYTYWLENAENYSSVKDSMRGMSVERRPVTLKSDNYSWTYDGEGHQWEHATDAGMGFVGSQGVTYDNFSTIVNVGSIDNEFSYTLKEGTDAANYKFDTVYGSISITPYMLMVTMVDTFKTYGYPNPEFRCTFSNPVHGESITDVVSGSPAYETDATAASPAGRYNVMPTRGTLQSDNYDFTYAEGQLQVRQRTIKIRAKSFEHIYDGNTYSYLNTEGEHIEFVDADLYEEDTVYSILMAGSAKYVSTVPITISNAQVKDANGVNVTSNYSISYENGTLTITPIETDVLVTSEDSSKTYDGTPLVQTRYSYTDGVLLTGDTLFAVITTSITDYGSSENTIDTFYVVHGTDTINHCYPNISKAAKNIEITKRAISITAKDSTKVYDGTPLVSTNIMVDNLASTDQVVSVTCSGTITEVGLIENNLPGNAVIKRGDIDVIALEDYVITYLPGKLTVIKDTNSIVITSLDSTWTYDGKMHTGPRYQVSYNGHDVSAIPSSSVKFKLPTGDTLTMTPTNGITEVSESAAENNTFDYELQHSECYTVDKITKVYGSLTVNKAELTVIPDSTGRGYGESDPDFTYKMTGFVNSETEAGLRTAGKLSGDVVVTTAETPASIPGEYTSTADVSGLTAANYTFASASGKFTITNRTTPYEITVKSKGDTLTYNGQYQEISGFDSTEYHVDGRVYTVEGLYTPVLRRMLPDSVKHAVSGTAIVYDADHNDVTAQFNVTVDTGRLVILPIKSVVTIKSETDSKVYDGTALTNSGFSYTTGILLENDSLGVTITGSQTEVGSSDNTIASYSVWRKKSAITNLPLTAGGAYPGLTSSYVDVTSGYTLASETGTLTVTKSDAMQVICPTDADTVKVYDGTPLQPVATITDTLPGNPIKVKYRTSQDRGTSWTEWTEEIPSITNIDTIKVEVIAFGDNYDTASCAYSLMIKPAMLTITVNDSKTYDGMALVTAYTNTSAVVPSGLVADDAITAGVVTSDSTGVGTYKDSTAMASKITTAFATTKGISNYNVTYDFTQTITKRSLELTANSLDTVYDGKTHSYAETEVPHYGITGETSLATGETIASVTMTGAGTAVGDYTTAITDNSVVIKHDENVVTSNYAITLKPGNIRINGNKDSIFVTSKDTTYIYDGQSHTKEVYYVKYNNENMAANADGKTFVLPTGDALTITSTFGGITNVSENAEHNNTFTYALENDSYYMGKRDTTYGTVSITKAALTIAVNDSKTYDGTALVTAYTNTTAVVPTGLVAGDAVTAGVVTTDSTAVGTYKDSTAMASEIKTAFATTKGISNYNVSYDFTQEITTRPLELTANSKTGIEYDGNVHTYAETTSPYYTVTGGTSLADGQDITSLTVTGQGRVVGTYPTAVTENSVVIKHGADTVTANYAITLKSGQLEIVNRTTPYEIVLVPTNKTVTYSGVEQTVSGFDTLKFTVDGNVYAVSGVTVSAAGTKAGLYEGTANLGTVVVKDAYDSVVTSQFSVSSLKDSLTITKASLSIVVNDSKPYDGQPLTTAYNAGAAKFSATGLQSIDAIVAGAVVSSGSAVGTYTTGYTVNPAVVIKHGADTVTASYNLNYTVSQEITASDDFTFTLPTTTTKVYDGTPLQPVVTASVTTGETVTVEYSTDSTNWNITPIGITNVGSQKVYARAHADNYTDKGGSYTLTVTPAALTIKLDTTKVYDGTKFVSEYAAAGRGYTVTGLVAGDAVTAGVVTTDSTGVGTYKDSTAMASEITTAFATTKGISNYNVSYDFTQVITPAALVISLDTTKVYDGTKFVSEYAATGRGYTVTGLQNGATITAGVVTTDSTGVGVYRDSTAMASVITTVFATSDNISNYSVTYDFTQEIILAPLAISLDTAKVYDGTKFVSEYAAAGRGYTVTGLQNGATIIAGVVTSDSTGVGVYRDSTAMASVITTAFATSDNISNYAVTYDFTQEITLAPLAISLDTTKVYDGTKFVSEYAAAGRGYSVTGLVAGDAVTAGVVTSDSTGVGTYKDSTAMASEITTAFATTKGISNYNVTYDFTQVITPAALAISLDTTKVYDGTKFVSEYAATGRGYSVTGLQNGATITAGVVTTDSTGVGVYRDLTAMASVITTAFATSDNISNYAVTYDFTQEITLAPLAISLDTTKVYDGTKFVSEYAAAGRGYTVTGLVAGDAVTAGVVTSDSTGVGTYKDSTAMASEITTAFATTKGISNYAVTYDFTQEITLAPLAISLDTTKVYDGTKFVSEYAATGRGYTVTGLVAGDAVTAGVVTSDSTGVGTYKDSTAMASEITTAFATTKGISNYNVSYDFTQVITPAALVISLDTAKVYDGTKFVSEYAAAGRGYTVTGLQNGATIIAGVVTSDSTGVGVYRDSTAMASVITTAFATSDNISNYAVTYDFTQEITLAPLAISLDTTKVYDGTKFVSEYAAAGRGYTVTGLQNGATIIAGVVTSDSTGVGVYRDSTAMASVITTAFATSDNISNYAVTYDFTQEITLAPLAISLDTTKVYDGTKFVSEYAAAGRGYTVTGLVAGDAVTAGVVTTDSTGVGTYKDSTAMASEITTAFATTKGISNYNVTYDFTQVITPAALTIKLDTTKVYDGTQFVSEYAAAGRGYTVTGLVAGDAVTAGVVTSDSTGVGTYKDSTAMASEITTAFATTKGISNYAVTYDFTQEITLAPLAISLDTTKVYDGTKFVSEYAAAGRGYTVTGLVAGDAVTAGVVTTDSTGVGTYKDSMAMASEITTAFATTKGISNYNVSYDFTQVITPAALVISLDTTKVYDGTKFVSEYAAAGRGYTVTGLQNGATITAGVVTTDSTGVGVYRDSTAMASVITTAFATSDNISNYNVSYDFTQEITLAPLAISLDTTKAYDGTKFVSEYAAAGRGYTVTGLVAGDAVTAGMVTSDSTGVGTYKDSTAMASEITTAFATTKGISNYNVSYDFTQVITPAALTIKLDTTKVYDGTKFVSEYAATGRGYTVTGLQSGATVTAGVVTSAMKNAKVYTDSATVDSAYISTKFRTSDSISNYNVIYDFRQEITKDTTPILIASASKDFTYDAQYHSYPVYSVTYGTNIIPRMAVNDSLHFVLPTGDTVTFTPDPNAKVKDYDPSYYKNNTFTYSISNYAGNYVVEKLSVDTGTIRISAFTDTIKIASLGKTWTYDGNVHEYKKYTVQFGGEFAQQVSALDSTRFVMPITKDTLSIISSVSITDAGKVANTFTYTLQNDMIYIGPRDTIIDTLCVNPLTGVVVTINGHDSTDVIYNGYDHKVTGYDIANISSSLFNASNIHYLGNVKDTTAYGRYAGTYTMTMSGASFENTNPNFKDVTFTVTPGDLTISPMPTNIYITAASAEKNYDGTSLVDSTYTYYTALPLANGDTLVAVVEGIITDPGQVDNVVTEYAVLRKSSMNASMSTTGLLGMVRPTGYDTNITYCYTFATPATIKGTLTIYDSLWSKNIAVNDVRCYGEKNGSDTITVKGGKSISGTVDYNYKVEGPNSYLVTSTLKGEKLILSSLDTGTYTVTFTDALDSTTSVTFHVSQPDTLTALASVQADLCPNQSQYDVWMVTAGGNGGNTLSWGCDAFNVNAAATHVNKIGVFDCDREYKASVKVVDRRGCVAVDTVTFTVEDHDAPSFTVPNDTIVCRESIFSYAVSINPDNTGKPTDLTDNCSPATALDTLVSYEDVNTTNDDNQMQKIERTWKLRDLCGNETTHVQYIYVRAAIHEGNTSFNCPADVYDTIRHGGGVSDKVNIGWPTFTSATYYDMSNVVISNNAPADSIYPVGTTVVTWTVTDSCGFVMSCDQHVFISHTKCPDAVDFEGVHYPSVRLGSDYKCWTAENLRSTKYSDGRPINNPMSYNDDDDNALIYGRLYDWYAAADTTKTSVDSISRAYEHGNPIQGICPEGWYLPSDEEFEDLNIYPAYDLRSTNYWITNTGTNLTEFNARPAGRYNCAANRYEELGGNTYYWTCHPVLDKTTGMMLDYICEQFIRVPNVDRCSSFSVRCIYDER